MIIFLTKIKIGQPSLLFFLLLVLFANWHSAQGRVQWERNTLLGPHSGNQQTACVVADLDKDGIDDFVITERTKTPSVVWYKYNGKSWDMKVIDNTHLNPEAGGDTLVIWFRGDSGNAAEQMYVTLNSSARLNNDNPDAAMVTKWTQWTIDLSRFTDQGVNLSNVNSITLGLSSATGGAGMIYFDDIRLHPPTP